MSSERKGYIYVLTNESFHKENWIKIGYAEDVDKRVKELSGTAVPLPYEIYCTYEIPRISGVKDPDKLLHDLITKLNPNLRITPNREFFEMFPWDAYDMLYAIAQMHGRTEKLVRNKNNASDQEVQKNTEYTLEALYPEGSEIRRLYENIKSLILSIDNSLEIKICRLYISFKKGKRNVLCLWPRSEWIEVILNAKLGQIKDSYDLIYDISNRQWSAEQYAFKLFSDTDSGAVKDIIQQTINLKK